MHAAFVANYPKVNKHMHLENSTSSDFEDICALALRKNNDKFTHRFMSLRKWSPGSTDTLVSQKTIDAVFLRDVVPSTDSSTCLQIKLIRNRRPLGTPSRMFSAQPMSVWRSFITYSPLGSFRLDTFQNSFFCIFRFCCDFCEKLPPVVGYR